MYYRGVRDVVQLRMDRGASLGGTESKLIQEWKIKVWILNTGEKEKNVIELQSVH